MTFAKAMWKLELDEEYFRIYDSKKMVAGYFDPDYGKIGSGDAAEIIEHMLKNRDTIYGGFVMVPMVKFNLFDSDLNTHISNVDAQVRRVTLHMSRWMDFLSTRPNQEHYVRISHTDQDMLTITFPVNFSEPTRLHGPELLNELVPTLDLLQELGLL